MASLIQDPTSGIYHVRFRYANQSFKRSLHTQNTREANSALGRIEETLRLLACGSLEMPENADPGLYIFSGGKLAEKPKLSKEQPRTLAQVFQAYHEMLPSDTKEQSTLGTEKIHVRHLLQHLGDNRLAQNLSRADVQRYVTSRSRDTWRGQTIKGDTIKKEIATLRVIWDWAAAMDYVNGPAPVKGIQYPKRDEREPFQSWDEIERRTARGGLTESEGAVLWACLFLRRTEIDEVLKFVKEVAQHPFIYPMFVFAAHTGARRSEILRSQIDDFQFEDRVVLIREKKRRRDRKISFRRVDMSPFLRGAMQEWFKNHPGGHYTIAPPRVMSRGKSRGESEPLTANEARDHFKRTLEGSKWEKIQGFHVFRHSFASNAALAGVPEPIVDHWMGHMTDEMRRRYRHLFPEQRRSAIESIFGGDGP